MTTAILATLVVHNSKGDIYGNRYWAFTFTDHVTGKSFSANCDTDSGVRGAMRAMGYDNNAVLVHVDEMPIRQFIKFIKGFEYAGCISVDVAKYIERKIREVKA